MSIECWADSKALFVILLFIAIFTFPMLTVSANTEEVGRDDTVATRQRPALDPLGVRLGGFILSPKLSVGLRNNDNIFAVNTDTTSDRITLINPVIELKSNWSEHALNLLADLELGRYSDNPNEDYEDATITSNGQLNVSRNSQFSGTLQYAELHEPRTSPDDVQGEFPTEYTETIAFFAYTHKFSHLSLQLGTSQRSYDYQDTAALVTTINNDDRDRVEMNNSLQLDYSLKPGFQLFVRGKFNSRKYDQRTDQFGFRRSSDGYELNTGAVLLSGVTKGDIYVGYLTQSYDDDRFDKLEEPTFGGELTWNLSGLTTLTGAAQRYIDETTFNNASGIRLTHYKISVDHELRRYLILHADITKNKENYNGIDRKDDVSGYNLNLSYMLSRNFYISFNYDYERRESAPFANGINNYKNNIYTLRITGQI